MLTRDLVEKALPPNLKSAATQAFTDQINNIVADPIIAGQVRDNFISYSSVLRDGKFKTEDYLHAVTYVSFKLMGLSNQDAYFRTFPQRYQALVAKGTSTKDISAYVAAYAKGKLVNLILEQSLVPSWVLNQEAYQKAINTQVEIMEDTGLSAMARTAAANSILSHLSKPKEAGPLVAIDLRETSGMTELKQMLTALAHGQRQAISNGVPTKDIAAQRLVEVEPEEVPNATP